MNSLATSHDSNSPVSGRKLRVAVLMGGISNERAVSLSTGRQIFEALDRSRYEVRAIDTQDLLPGVRSTRTSSTPDTSDDAGEQLPLAAASEPASETPGGENALQIDFRTALGNDSFQRPDVVFIALHGKGGEDGSIQGMLDLLGIPYTGSGVLASALAMDKAMSKRMFRAAGIPVLRDMQVLRGQSLPEADLIQRVQSAVGPLPVFVKPNSEGSTFGCTLVTTPQQLAPAVARALEYSAVALIERYARGTEVTVGVLGATPEALQALPVVEIVPRNTFYDYESKYAEGGSDHIIPARLSPHLTQRVQQIALACHSLLGCHGMSRTDFILAENVPYVLEVNTIPGMTPTSLLPQAAAAAGIAFPALLDGLIEYALHK